MNTPPPDDMTVEHSLHAKYVTSPRRISTELEHLIGAGRYVVEMRHNIYNIKACQEFSLDELMSRCRGLVRHHKAAPAVAI